MAWLVVMPAIHFFGQGLTTPLYPGTKLISEMSPSDLWTTYIRPMGAGAVAAAGLITLLKTVPTILAALKAGADGAVCVFDGIVRDNTRGRRTLYLDYEAYEEMALNQMRSLAEEALAKFGVRDISVVHRLGRLYVGESSVLIVVASAHRGAAFDACRWLIDTLKKTVPIWKKEQFEDGAVWADGEPFPEEIVRG